MSNGGVLQFKLTWVIPERMDGSKQSLIHIDIEELWVRKSWAHEIRAGRAELEQSLPQELFLIHEPSKLLY